MDFETRQSTEGGAEQSKPGGIVHTYLGYDAKNFPSPRQPPPDLTGVAFDHLMMYGSRRKLTAEELARAVKIDPSQIAGMGPSLDALRALLLDARRRILERYETEHARAAAAREYADEGKSIRPPKGSESDFARMVRQEQIRDFERLYYTLRDDQSAFARDLVKLLNHLGAKYQIEELASKYHFTGREQMSVPKALQVKEELEAIDKLLKQLEEAAKDAQIGIIDMEELSRFAEEADIERLQGMQRQIEEYIRQMAERQGLEQTRSGFQMTPSALRLFQSRLLQEVFGELEASRSGRHSGQLVGEGPIEMQKTRGYQFGDSVASMDIPGSFVNAMVRERSRKGGSPPGLVRLHADDIEIHQTRNNPRCATAVLMDMSGSMRYDGQYINVKRMALGLDGLIRREYPGDYLQFIEVYSVAKACTIAEVPELMPKPVTIQQPVVRLKADMSRPGASELLIPPHFTNIQHGLRLARQFLGAQDTPNRQVILITDGLPTAHYEGQNLFLLYPPDPATERATMREAMLCRKEGITINIFLLPSWSQSEDDVQFAHTMAEATQGRVFFTGGRDLDRFVLWDYVNHRRRIIA